MSGRLNDSRLRVLVIEDDDATRTMLAEFLAEEGFAVSSALDGAHALRAASAHRPDVVVLDLGLPVLDGAGVPIVAVSGLPYGAEMARQIGAAAYYRKPLDLPAFARVLRELADGRAVRIKPTEEIA